MRLSIGLKYIARTGTGTIDAGVSIEGLLRCEFRDSMLRYPGELTTQTPHATHAAVIPKSEREAKMNTDYVGFTDDEVKQLQSTSAVQIGDQRVEYHKPDMGLAYAVLAPLVTEALAYLDAGNEKKGMAALRRAREVIDSAGLAMATISIVRHSSDADSQK